MADKVTGVLNLLKGLLKQTPKTNPPSGAISQIPNKQELERAALRDLELFKMNKGRDPTPEETKLILDNNLGALGFVNIGDLINRGALKDIYRSPLILISSLKYLITILLPENTSNNAIFLM